MTVKRHAILLTTGIVVLVFLCLAFANVVGCKDKVEAKELDDTDFILWPDPIFLRVELKEEPTFEDGETRIYLYKGDDFDVVIEKKEPNEPKILFENVNEHPKWNEEKGHWDLVEDEPNEHKPDTSKLVGGVKKIAELIEYYHER